MTGEEEHDVDSEEASSVQKALHEEKEAASKVLHPSFLGSLNSNKLLRQSNDGSVRLQVSKQHVLYCAVLYCTVYQECGVLWNCVFHMLWFVCGWL